MAKIAGITVDVNIDIPEETALKCLKILEMYLMQENHLKVTCKRVDGAPILAFEERKRRIEPDGKGMVFEEYLE